MGDPARGRRFQTEMFRLRTPDYDRKKACREEYERDPQKRNGLRYVNCE